MASDPHITEKPLRLAGKPWLDGDAVRMSLGSHAALVQMLDGETIAITLKSVRSEAEALKRHSWVVSEEHQVLPWQISNDGTPTRLHCAKTTVDIAPDPLSWRIFHQDQQDIARSGASAFSAGPRGLRFQIEIHEQARIFGLGEKGRGFNRRGHVYEMWNTDAFLYDRGRDPLYKSIPFFMVVHEGHACGFFLDAPERQTLDCAATDPTRMGMLVHGANEATFYVLPGPSPREVLRRYFELTGMPLLPPRWALGYQQCRYSYANAQRMLDVARGLRERQIPCDVLYLDIHYMDGFRSFTWDTRAFPDPAAMLRSLHDQGFHVVAIIDPGLCSKSVQSIGAQAVREGLVVTDDSGQPATGEVWPGTCVFPDFANEDARKWWGSHYSNLLKMGLDGFWNDMNEPASMDSPTGTLPEHAVHQGPAGALRHSAFHNIYGHMMAKATVEGVSNLRPGVRPFVLTRAAYAGTHALAASWGGDNSSTWEDLRLSVEMAQHMAASGFSLYGPDIGGFEGRASPELFLRWMQVGTFMGLMRSHAYLGTPDQEPWCFGEEWTTRIRNAIGWRYRLRNYLYSHVHRHHRGALPLVRPLWMIWPECDRLHNKSDAFMCGRDLLVAPVLHPDAPTRTIPLPPGRWYRFPDGKAIPEDLHEWTVHTSLEEIPVLVRAGAIIPVQDVLQNMQEPDSETLHLHVFANGDGDFEFVEEHDDGTTSTIRFDTFQEALHFKIVIDAPSPKASSITQRFLLEIHGLLAAPDSLNSNGVMLTPRTPAQFDENPVSGLWTWDPQTSTARLMVAVSDLPVRIVTSDPPRQAPEQTLRAIPTEHPEKWPNVLPVNLDSDQHGIASPHWQDLPMALRAQASWNAEGIVLHIEVTPTTGEPPTYSPNHHLDGLHLRLAIPTQKEPALLHFRLPPPWEDADPVVYRGRVEVPHPDLKLETRMEGRLIRYSSKLPPSLFGLPQLTQGLSCAIDFWVQHSDVTGRRGTLRWGRPIPLHEPPAGRLVLT